MATPKGAGQGGREGQGGEALGGGAGRGTERSGGQLERGRHCGQDGERAPGTQTGEPSLLPALPYAAARGLPLLGGPRPCGRRSLLFRGAGSQSRPSFLGVRASSPPLLSVSEATRCVFCPPGGSRWQSRPARGEARRHAAHRPGPGGFAPPYSGPVRDTGEALPSSCDS